MFINSIILAISSSIDSLGIGITYGVKDTTISYIGKVTLFMISFSITIIALWFGNVIKDIFPENFIKFIGAFILIFMGFFMCYQALTKDSKTEIKEKKFILKKSINFLLNFLVLLFRLLKILSLLI